MSNKNKSKKEFLCIFLAIDKPYGNFFLNSNNNLLSNKQELENILRNKENNSNIICFLCFNNKKIEKMLYINEEVIEIISDFINKENISDYFYLTLLIENNPDIINYVYEINILRELKKKLKVDNKSSYEKIIISKIGMELINNYKQSEIYEESDDEELISLENEFLSVIVNNVSIFKEFNLSYTAKDIKEKNLDLIYIEIIINLIRQKRFENFEYTMNILKQLDIEHIKLTETMFNKLKNELDKKEYELNYQINGPNDLNVKNKLKFFYLLLYILKEPAYIYKIDLLIKARRAIINLIKEQKTFVKNDELEYIIKKLVDSEYYWELYLSKRIINNENNTSIETINTNIYGRKI